MLPQVDRPGTLEKVITSLQAVLKLLRPFDDPDPWHRPTLNAGWVLDPATALFGDPLQPGYKKDPLGRVHLRGWVTRTSGIDTVIFTLPAGYRPSHYVYVSPLVISPLGVVSVDSGTTGVLNCKSFDTEG